MPQGVFWVGCANTPEQHIKGLLCNPMETDGRTPRPGARTLRTSPYGAQIIRLFGSGVFANACLAETMFAIGLWV